MQQFIVQEDLSGKTLKEYFAMQGFSTTQIKRFKYNGSILVNETPVTVRYVLQKGDCVQLETNLRLSTPQFADTAAKVLFADKYLYVAEKPCGVAIHPDRAHCNNTFGNLLATAFGNGFELHLVTRLDKTTSGLVLGAFDEITAQKLNALQQQHQIEKHYYALVEGNLEKDSGTIDLPLLRDDATNKTIAHPQGKPSTTLFEVVCRNQRTTLLHLQPQTGRTHQIRAHLSAIGHPIVGDTLYGAQPATRVMLHCAQLTFRHPHTSETITITAPHPFDVMNE